jgi:RimJ/RimL family protein N-acetyltransferase
MTRKFTTLLLKIYGITRAFVGINSPMTLNISIFEKRINQYISFNITKYILFLVIVFEVLILYENFYNFWDWDLKSYYVIIIFISFNVKLYGFYIQGVKGMIIDPYYLLKSKCKWVIYMIKSNKTFALACIILIIYILHLDPFMFIFDLIIVKDSFEWILISRLAILSNIELIILLYYKLYLGYNLSKCVKNINGLSLIIIPAVFSFSIFLPYLETLILNNNLFNYFNLNWSSFRQFLLDYRKSTPRAKFIFFDYIQPLKFSKNFYLENIDAINNHNKIRYYKNSYFLSSKVKVNETSIFKITNLNITYFKELVVNIVSIMDNLYYLCDIKYDTSGLRLNNLNDIFNLDLSVKKSYAGKNKYMEIAFSMKSINKYSNFDDYLREVGRSYTNLQVRMNHNSIQRYNNDIVQFDNGGPYSSNRGVTQNIQQRESSGSQGPYNSFNHHLQPRNFDQSSLYHLPSGIFGPNPPFLTSFAKPTNLWPSHTIYQAHSQNTTSSTLVFTTRPFHTNISEFETDRLIIRPLVDRDFWQYYETQKPERYLEGEELDIFVKQTREFFFDRKLRDFLAVGIFLKNLDGTEGQIIGEGGVSNLDNSDYSWPEVYYCMIKEYRSKGYTTEFLKSFLEVWWSLPRDFTQMRVKIMSLGTSFGNPYVREQLGAVINRNNIGSIKVVEKAGFKYCGNIEGQSTYWKINSLYL